ncbi:hypothetical protein FPQ18DRAFT_408946 [Pyronema domesticum]|uniref:Hydrophobin n=1 Tax=Pyronema omphalodes (strain CBS 100304) TaxID=1076935 RepID=U4KZM5_PYROM|nr:hypothetical protein FPQ18DRAFT_408946 [Pyronema domesticum]CCX05154.1 Protein of unknown function [Pyronema omphalodes CBS 100304]
MKLLLPILFSLVTFTIAAPTTHAVPARPGSPLKNPVNLATPPKPAGPAKPAASKKPGTDFPNGVNPNGLPKAKLTDCNYMKVGKPGSVVKGISGCCPDSFVGCTVYEPMLGCGPRREVCCDKSVGVQRDAKKAKANCVTTNFATGP